MWSRQLLSAALIPNKFSWVTKPYENKPRGQEWSKVGTYTPIQLDPHNETWNPNFAADLVHNFFFRFHLLNCKRRQQVSSSFALFSVLFRSHFDPNLVLIWMRIQKKNLMQSFRSSAQLQFNPVNNNWSHAFFTSFNGGKNGEAGIQVWQNAHIFHESSYCLNQFAILTTPQN